MAKTPRHETPDSLAARMTRLGGASVVPASEHQNPVGVDLTDGVLQSSPRRPAKSMDRALHRQFDPTPTPQDPWSKSRSMIRSIGASVPKSLAPSLTN